MSKVRWGVLSTASIGRLVVEATRGSRHSDFVAVASRTADRARAFADELGLAHAFGSYDELLAADDVDAVYVALPVALHAEWVVKALRAGKHVLCEKPLAMTAEDGRRCFDAASAAGRVLAEGLMYRHHPQTLVARRLVDQGAIGTLAYVRAALSVSVDPGDIRRSAELGGGALLDLGCYCVSAVRLFAGEPRVGYAQDVPDRLPAGADAEAVDLRLSASLRMPADVLAQFDVGLDLTRRDELELVGTEGRLTVPDPWLCRTGEILLHRHDGTESVPADPDGRFGLGPGEHDAYRIEFDTVSAAIRDGTEPASGRDDAVAQAAILEGLRRSSRDQLPVAFGHREPV